jgi:hypothetical protein
MNKPSSKIIQITGTPRGDIYALCEDGSLWERVYVSYDESINNQFGSFKWELILEKEQKSEPA